MKQKKEKMMRERTERRRKMRRKRKVREVTRTVTSQETKRMVKVADPLFYLRYGW